MYNINIMYNFTEAIDKSTCDKIKMLAEDKWITSGTIAGEENVRKNDVGWIEDQWVYDIIWPFVFKANDKSGWKYRIDSSENIQISRYKEGDFYSWHKDGKEEQENRIRKLSMTVLLNDDYEGGEFQFANYSEEKCNIHTPAPNKTGTVIVFPSDTEHRVTPVTKGIRYSLVAWFLGPPFI